MAEIATVARPYAEAAFRAALERNALGTVADGLALLAAIARDEQMRSILLNPKVSAKQKKEIFAAAAGERLDEISANLLALLVDNRREVLIASIEEQLEELTGGHQHVIRARITSAQPLSDAQRDDIVAALEKRYGKKVEA